MRQPRRKQGLQELSYKERQREPEPQAERKRVKRDSKRAARTELDQSLPSDEYMESSVGFCCAVCRCSDEIKEKVPLCEDGSLDMFISSDHTADVWHRRCCHRQFEYDEHWFSPYDKGSAGSDFVEPAQDKKFVWEDIHCEYQKSKDQEKKDMNELGNACMSAA